MRCSVRRARRPCFALLLVVVLGCTRASRVDVAVRETPHDVNEVRTVDVVAMDTSAGPGATAGTWREMPGLESRARNGGATLVIAEVRRSMGMGCSGGCADPVVVRATVPGSMPAGDYRYVYPNALNGPQGPAIGCAPLGVLERDRWETIAMIPLDGTINASCAIETGDDGPSRQWAIARFLVPPERESEWHRTSHLGRAADEPTVAVAGVVGRLVVALPPTGWRGDPQRVEAFIRTHQPVGCTTDCASIVDLAL